MTTRPAEPRRIGKHSLMAGLAVFGLGEARPRAGRQITHLRLPPHRASTADLQAQALAFIAYYNWTMAKPFRWTYQGKALMA